MRENGKEIGNKKKKQIKSKSNKKQNKKNFYTYGKNLLAQNLLRRVLHFIPAAVVLTPLQVGRAGQHLC